jgi:hypothetical protein
MFGWASRGRRRAWLPAVAACAALLIVPLVALLVVPSGPSARWGSGASSAAPVSSEIAAPPEPAGNRTRFWPRPAPADDDDQDEVPAEEPPPNEPTVRGVVVDADGKPVAGASVRCADRELRAAGTDEEGKFELSPDAAGCRAVALGRTQSASEQVAMVAGDGNRLVLGRGGAISGVVVDEKGAAVPGYVIAVESFVPRGGEGAVPMGRPRRIDDARGAFELTELPAGRYVLTASADARPPARSGSIEVEAGRTTHHVRLVLARGASFSGVVTDADSRKPIADAKVILDTATTTGANAIPEVTTDAAGAFTLAGVPPRGLFSVRVTHPGYRTKILSGLDVRGASTLTERVALKPRGDGGGDSELAGIGAFLVNGRGGVVVAGVVQSGPAEKAGLKKDDRLVQIDGDDAGALTLADCVQRLRGPEGSRLALRVAREGAGTVDVHIVRGIVVR